MDFQTSLRPVLLNNGNGWANVTQLHFESIQTVWERVGVIAMQPYQVPIVPQYFSSHRWKSTKYPHDLWNRSKSHQIQKTIPEWKIDPWCMVLTHMVTHMIPPMPWFVRWLALPLWVSADFPKRSRRRESLATVGVPAADRGPKKACPRQRSVLLLRYCPRLSHWGFCLLLGLPVLLVLMLLQGSLGLGLLWKHGGDIAELCYCHHVKLCQLVRPPEENLLTPWGNIYILFFWWRSFSPVFRFV